MWAPTRHLRGGGGWGRGWEEGCWEYDAGNTVTDPGLRLSLSFPSPLSPTFSPAPPHPTWVMNELGSVAQEGKLRSSIFSFVLSSLIRSCRISGTLIQNCNPIILIFNSHSVPSHERTQVNPPKSLKSLAVADLRVTGSWASLTPSSPRARRKLQCSGIVQRGCTAGG